MSKVENITNDLEYINKNFTTVTSAYSKNDQNMGGDLPHERHQDFYRFINDFKNFGVFLQESDLNSIATTIRDIKNNLDIIIESVDVEANKIKASKIFDQISKLPNISKLKFSPNKEITRDKLLILIDETIDYFRKYDVNNDLPDVLKTLSSDQFEKFKELAIEYINMYRNTTPSRIERLADITNYFMNLLKPDLDKAIEEANQELITIKTLKGIEGTDKLSKTFKIEADTLDSKISNFSTAILTIFIVLLLFIILLLIMTFNGKFFSFPSNVYFYHFYLSLFLISTGLLTYLIKERGRLVKHQHYCKITSLELDALTEYIAVLTNKDKAEDLQISLADRYFRGPNFDPNASSSSQDFNIITSKISEISKTIEEIKRAIK